MQVKPDCAATVERTARKLLRHQAQYQTVEAKTGMIKPPCATACPRASGGVRFCEGLAHALRPADVVEDRRVERHRRLIDQLGQRIA